MTEIGQAAAAAGTGHPCTFRVILDLLMDASDAMAMDRDAPLAPHLLILISGGEK